MDFKKLVYEEKENIVRDLIEIVRIKSVLTKFDPKNEGAPFGENIKIALDWFLNKAKSDGFNTENTDGYAGHIEFGDGKKFIGTIGHLDVVPEGRGWIHEPYGGEIDGEKIYGRGTLDDKGPTLAMYYAMKILKNTNLKLNHRIKLILGTDEETAWRGIEYYFKKNPEQPVYGIIPDADFPLIYAEKGISRINIEFSSENTGILSLNGGDRDNMVPDYAEVSLEYKEKYEKHFKEYLQLNKYTGEVKKINDKIFLSINGKSAHGSTPHEGINAIDLMLQFLIKHVPSDFTDTYKKYFLNDLTGKKLGIEFKSVEMGKTSSNVGVIKKIKSKIQLKLNYRYPKGVEFDRIIEKIKSNLKNALVSVDHHKRELYQDPKSEFIKILMDTYQKNTQDYNSKPFTIGGGTFARSMKNSVAYGAHFKGSESNIHQPEEFIYIKDLLKATTIYAEALYRLANYE